VDSALGTLHFDKQPEILCKVTNSTQLCHGTIKSVAWGLC